MNIITIIIILLLVILLVGITYNLYNNYIDIIMPATYNYNKDQILLLEIEKLKNKNLELKKDIVSLSNNQNTSSISIPTLPQIPIPAIAEDLLSMYDRQTTFDPMTEPTKRPPRHVIMPIIGNPHFNYPTKGFTDSYSLKGYLVKDSHHDRNTDNNKDNNKDNTDNKVNKITENQILKLFGREKFPNSIEYEYYVIINTGFDDKIKYFLEKQTKELFDSDSVYIDILQSKYNVKLLKDKNMVYNPYLF